VPKNIEDDIFELTKDVNIFVDNLENYIKDESEYSSWYTINLTTPKFTLKTDLDFKPSLTNLGFGDIFNPNIDSFKNAFNDENLVNYNIYVDKMKQRNQVEFNEDGTIVKSLSTAHFGKASSAPPGTGNTLDVELNQPFIYIIRDINDTPIFVGHVDNPKG
jgi:serpin B